MSEHYWRALLASAMSEHYWRALLASAMSERSDSSAHALRTGGEAEYRESGALLNREPTSL